MLTNKAEESITELSPNDLALVAWALARTLLPNDAPIFTKIKQ
jgi:hypothetical protein